MRATARGLRRRAGWLRRCALHAAADARAHTWRRARRFERAARRLEHQLQATAIRSAKSR
jgi:hypothetical protein